MRDGAGDHEGDGFEDAMDQGEDGEKEKRIREGGEDGGSEGLPHSSVEAAADLGDSMRSARVVAALLRDVWSGQRTTEPRERRLCKY